MMCWLWMGEQALTLFFLLLLIFWTLKVKFTFYIFIIAYICELDINNGKFRHNDERDVSLT